MDIRTAHLNQEYPEYKNIPGEILDSLAAYVEHGTQTGGFLTKVLENDLMGAFNRADLENRRSLSALAHLLFNHVPPAAYGSPENVSRWIHEKRSALCLDGD